MSRTIDTSKPIAKLMVRYWHSQNLKGLSYDHMAEPEKYSYERSEEIVNNIISKGYNVMLQQWMSETGERTLCIWIDDSRFGQR